MEDKGHLKAGETGNPNVPSPTLKAEQYTKLLQSKEVKKTVLPTGVKKEDIPEVPLKVPRFQYVDFPSLHQCIQQLTVPPLDTWLESCTVEQPSACTPVSETVPRFKYVDYPSLHHCIKQLCVPPLKSWSSGNANPGTRFHDREGHESTAQPAPAHRQDTNTAFPFPSPGPNLPQCVTTSSKKSHKHTSSSPPKVGSICQKVKPNDLVLLSEHPSQRSTAYQSPLACMKHCKVLENQRQSGRKWVNDVVHKETSESRFLLTQQQAQAGPRDTPDIGLELWSAIPELFCQICQNMFADPEELRIHQRSHREKSH